MRLICVSVVLSVVMMSVSPIGAAERPERIQAANETMEPFRVIGNIYYVGGQYGSYLITTPEGHILHDTGTADMHELIVSNVEKLGFNVQDIRIMISSHAHWVDNPRHPTVVEDTQRTLRRLKELAPPDLFLHNHARETSSGLNPDLPVNPNCASCLDAEGWTAMVESAEARFQSMLTER